MEFSINKLHIFTCLLLIIKLCLYIFNFDSTGSLESGILIWIHIYTSKPDGIFTNKLFRFRFIKTAYDNNKVLSFDLTPVLYI
jgi:hypothetical protein